MSVACDNCAVTLHRDCRQSLTRCPTLGCTLRVSVHAVRWSLRQELRDVLPYAVLCALLTIAIVGFILYGSEPLVPPTFTGSIY